MTIISLSNQIRVSSSETKDMWTLKVGSDLTRSWVELHSIDGSIFRHTHIFTGYDPKGQAQELLDKIKAKGMVDLDVWTLEPKAK